MASDLKSRYGYMRKMKSRVIREWCHVATGEFLIARKAVE